MIIINTYILGYSSALIDPVNPMLPLRRIFPRWFNISKDIKQYIYTTMETILRWIHDSKFIVCHQTSVIKLYGKNERIKSHLLSVLISFI